MKILLLAFGLMFSFNVVQAQYETLIQTKLEHLNQLSNSVETDDDLPNRDKTWALKHINASQVLLKRSNPQDLEALQAAERQINQTSKKVAGRILMAKKVKLINRITTLTAMIKQYKTEGLDTKRLETLKAAMELHLSRIEA